MLKRIYIGPAGWSYPDWNGAVYPLKKPRAFDPLIFITSYFNLIEINSTFYRLPTTTTSSRWAERAGHNPEFRFTVKANRRFTHSPEPLAPGEIEAFKHSIQPLHEGQKLLSVLLQFPWSFKDNSESRRRLGELTAGFAPFPLSIEVRHGSWAREPGFTFLKNSGVTVCCVDQPVIGDSLTPRTRLEGDAGAYFRLHGRNRGEWFKAGANRDMRYNYLYSPGELSPFVGPIREAAKTADRVVVVLNNHFRGQAVANALELKSMLLEKKVKVPAGLVKVYPRLETISEGDLNAPEQDGWLFGNKN